MPEKDVYETITLQKRWFKDPSEFEYICRQLRIDPALYESIESLDLRVDQVFYEEE